MNKQKLESLTNEWVRLAKNDIRSKLIDFMHATEMSPRETARDLGLSIGEIEQIIEGNGEITISTFAKLLIASGFALEIKPIHMTPMGSYENIPDEDFDEDEDLDDEDEEFEDEEFEDEEFEDEEFDDEDDEPIKPCTAQPRDSHGRFMSKKPKADCESPFEEMDSSKLRNIIRERLWDTEIDISHAHRAELIEFLNEKNRRINELKAEKAARKAAESDPNIAAFKESMRKALKENPHLREYAKKILGV